MRWLLCVALMNIILKIFDNETKAGLLEQLMYYPLLSYTYATEVRDCQKFRTSSAQL